MIVEPSLVSEAIWHINPTYVQPWWYYMKGSEGHYYLQKAASSFIIM